MRITPDDLVIFEWGVFRLNATILFTWVVMVLLVGVARIMTAGLSDAETPSRWQNFLEVLVAGMRDQIRDVSQQDPGRFLPFIGTLFLFIAVSNSLSVLPGFQAPTGSLSTASALAICVLVAVPLYGIVAHGPIGYLRTYLQPTWVMLPFNVIGELSRTIALAVRLYGNVMSGAVLGAILIGIVPIFVPTLMQLLGLLTGLIQAYIFAVLAMVYIAAASGARGGNDGPAAGTQASDNQP